MYKFKKGNEVLQVFEVDDLATVKGLNGFIEFFKLYSLLVSNGYKLIK